MNKNMRKDRLVMVARLLEAIKIHSGATFTRQWCSANLNHNEASKLVDGFLVCGFVSSTRFGNRVRYKVTEKGLEFLGKILECYMILDEVECCYSNVVDSFSLDSKLLVKSGRVNF